MKTKLMIAAALVGAALSTQARDGFGVSFVVPAPRVIVAPPPAVVVAPPAVTVVPDSYVWDGYENVGYVNGAYFYLGAGNAWLPLPGDRLARFHDWEGHHRDWRDHAIHNDRYRGDYHDRDHGHDHDRDFHHR